ncbi:helix-turn-helix domain-containing protein [Agrobacterium vitis]|uniref:helix-turn-helix domain-containing protein n=1 Tax=Agrobacterium vitis TaxID=373 RepID=UPI00398C646B
MPPAHMASWATPRTGRYLSFSLNANIAIEVAKDASVRAFAFKFQRSPSTVSREIRRDPNLRLRWLPCIALTRMFPNGWMGSLSYSVEV